jgi:hypothetical protein
MIESLTITMVSTFATGADLSAGRSQENIPRISSNRRRNEIVFISKRIIKNNTAKRKYPADIVCFIAKHAR